MTDIKHVCPHCGSDDIASEAVISFNVGKQAWEIEYRREEEAFCRECDADGFETSVVPA